MSPLRSFPLGAAAGLTAALVTLALPDDVAACSFGQTEHFFDAVEQVEDVTAPSTPSFEVEAIQRGVGPERAGCGQQSSTSCDDLGWITLRLLDVSDDRTARAEMGYLIETQGEVPEGLSVPDVPVRFDDNTFVLVWIDGAHDHQERIDFTVTMRAVDLGGNVSDPSAPVEVRDGAHDGTACAIAPMYRHADARASGLALPGRTTILVGVLVLLGLRRRHHT